MDQRLRVRDAVPTGFVVDCTTVDADRITFVLRSAAYNARCPLCGTAANHVHSRYRRRAADLPLGGRNVMLDVVVRRFRCESFSCPRRIFAERFDDGVLAPRARRTGRLEFLVRHLGLALGGRPAARFARRLSIPVSNDTLIRAVRRGRATHDVAPEVVGIDDFAFRRNCRYGTIIVDLKERRPLRLLPDREPATATAWLAAHASISTVTRDRANAYGEAISRALPQAVQVADRWHLMENASSAFLDAVRGSMKQIRSTIDCRAIDPELLTAAERLQYEGWLGRRASNDAVLALSRAGLPLKAIARRTGISRGTVRRILRGERNDVFRTRQSSLEAHLPWLEERWEAGHRNGAALWRALKARGFCGSLRVVAEWATRRRRCDKMDAGSIARTPSARRLARLMMTGRDHLTKSETVTVSTVEAGVPELVDARHLVDEFQTMIRHHDETMLTPWLSRATTSPVASFARGIARDEAAVRAAITSPWSNGQAEGQITKLKLVKRQMYGRGKLDLLEARLIGEP